MDARVKMFKLSAPGSRSFRWPSFLVLIILMVGVLVSLVGEEAFVLGTGRGNEGGNLHGSNGQQRTVRLPSEDEDIEVNVRRSPKDHSSVESAARNNNRGTFEGLKITRPVFKDKLRVLCPIIKNEAPFLKEWIDFHILAGWTHFHFWDHNSTDNYREVLDAYPKDLVEYTVINWSFEIKHPNQHRSMDAQVDVYNRCASKYWSSAEALMTTDVDEFVFPARSHWNDPDPFESAARALNASHPGSGVMVTPRMDCPRFGYRHLKETPTRDIIFKYPYRPPMTEKEVETAGLTRAAKLACKNFKYGCEPYGAAKRIFIINGQSTQVELMVHQFKGPGIIVPAILDAERTQGFICNHIWVRSLDQLRAKGAKNSNPMYTAMAALPQSSYQHAFYSAIIDRDAMDFASQALAKYRPIISEV